jgi:plastocyanin
MTDNIQTDAETDEAERSEGEQEAIEDAGAGETPATEAQPEGAVALEAEPPFEQAEGESRAELAAGPPPVDPVRDRLVLPLLLPLLSMFAVFLYVTNISRVFLASGENVSVVVGTIVTVGILAGGAAVSATPRLRSSTLVMCLAGFAVLVLSAGLLSLGPSEPKSTASSAGYKPPAGPPVATLEVDALPSLSFQAKQFSVPAGVIQVNYNDLGGTHTLVFSDPKLSGFQLAVPQGPKTGKVQLNPGSYEIYCTIPGHRAAGMDATVTVG